MSFNYADYYHKQFDELNRHSVIVGALSPVGNKSVSFLSMLVNVNNFGKDIVPVHTQYLTIPTPNADGKSASEIGGLFRYKTKTGKLTLAKEVDGKLTIFFILSKGVHIPARDFLGTTMDGVAKKVGVMSHNGIIDIMAGKQDWHGLYSQIGNYIVRSMQRKMKSIKEPANAKITQANKGFDNPLIDTGSLIASLSWRIVDA